MSRENESKFVTFFNNFAFFLAYFIYICYYYIKLNKFYFILI